MGQPEEGDMHWTGLLQWLVAGLAISVALYAAFALGRQRPVVSKDDAAADPMAARLAAHVHGRHLLRALLLGLGLLAALLALLWIGSAPRGYKEPDAWKDTSHLPRCVPACSTCPCDGGGQPIAPADTTPAAITHAFWGVLGLGAIGLTAGTVLLVVGREKWVKATGAATLIGTLLGEGALVNEVKFGNLFEAKIDKLSLEGMWQKKLDQLSGFGPEHLAVLRGFTTGDAAPTEEMKRQVKQLCAAHREKLRAGGLILVVGSADRVPLRQAVRAQYESNVGLAMARAEAVRQQVLDCGIDQNRVVTLVAGPRYTPVGAPNTDQGRLAEDRSVTIWGLFSVPLPRK
jgi:hypothetical protein